MKRGSTFGSQIFAAGTEAIAQGTYRASVPTDLLIIRKDVAHTLLAAGLLPDKETTRMSSTCQMLAEMPIFADLSPQQIEALFDQMKPQTVQQGQTIVEQGETRHHFFIIESGEVEVHIAANNRPARLVARLGQGEHFGETALYTDRPYGATCIAKTEVNLLLLDEFIFDRLVATTRHMTHYVEQVSSGRLKDNRRKLGFKTPTWSFNLETGERP
jgi:hypothetical protein